MDLLYPRFPRLSPRATRADATRGRAMVASQKTWTFDEVGDSLPQETASSKVQPERPPQWGASVVYWMA